jgi:subtilase family protein
MAIGNILTQIGQQPRPNPNQNPIPNSTPSGGGFGSLGGLGGGMNGGMGGGMAALMQQEAAMNQLRLSERARQAMNPTFDQAQTALTNSITNPAPRSDIQLNDRQQVAVLDTFMGGSPDHPAHGFGVADVVKQTAGLQNDQVALVSDTMPNFAVPSARTLLTAPGDASASDRVDAYIETMVAGGMSQTNSALEAISAQKDTNAPNLHGVNYSTSGTDLNGFMALNRVAIGQGPDGHRQLTPEGNVIFEGLGIEQTLNSGTLRQFAERGTARFGEVTENSELVQGQMDRHENVSKRLQEQGVHYTVSAGNDGGVIEDYAGVGVKMGDTADDNIYANQYNVTVGSLDRQGTADPTDDRVAAHSVNDPEVDFLADGVNRNVNVFGQNHNVSGTSYAAPDINGRLVRLSRENPCLSATAVQNLLHNSAGPAIAGSNISAIR